MARDCYETTIALPDAAAGYALKPLSAVKVSVVPRGAVDVAGSLVDIFPADTGASKGPDPKTGASGTNPFTTSVSGAVRFWAEGPAEYDLVFEDTQVPARIADRIGWNSTPAKAGSIPTSVLKVDGGITQGHLSALVIQQQVPIGGCMDWWRPSAGVGPPAGYEVADGRAVAHEFPGVAGNVTLPNLQNVFILGATVGKPDGSGAGADNSAGSGPGIRGTGGSNALKDLSHGHGVPGVDHAHFGHTLDHLHGPGGLFTGGHVHGVSVAGNSGPSALVQGNAAGSAVARDGHTHNGGTSDPGNIGIGGNVGSVTNDPSTWTDPADRSLNTATNSTTWSADPGTEFRPYFIGLLRLIKVRRTA